MDDDNQDNSGMGTLAAFQLGRWSTQQSQWVQDWKNSRHNAVVAKGDYDQAVERAWDLANENRRLAGHIDVLQAQVNNARADYKRLRVWANERQAEVEGLKAKCQAIEAISKEKSALISDISRRWRETLFGPPPPDAPEF